MFRKLAAAVLLGFLIAPAAHAEDQDNRLYMAPVDGIFSFTPGQLDLAGEDADAGPVLRPGGPDVGRLETFLEAHDGDTLLIVRGNRVLREVSANEDLYDGDGIIPLVESGVVMDEEDALEAPDRIDIWAVGTSIDLTRQIEAVDEGQSSGGAAAIMLKLTPEGRSMVQGLTSANAGRQIATLLERNILASPVVSGPVDSDVLAISFASPEDPARETWVMDTLRTLAGQSEPPPPAE
jgi:hypothetical protein